MNFSSRGYQRHQRYEDFDKAIRAFRADPDDMLKANALGNVTRRLGDYHGFHPWREAIQSLSLTPIRDHLSMELGRELATAGKVPRFSPATRGPASVMTDSKTIEMEWISSRKKRHGSFNARYGWWYAGVQERIPPLINFSLRALEAAARDRQVSLNFANKLDRDVGVLETSKRLAPTVWFLARWERGVAGSLPSKMSDRTFYAGFHQLFPEDAVESYEYARHILGGGGYHSDASLWGPNLKYTDNEFMQSVIRLRSSARLGVLPGEIFPFADLEASPQEFRDWLMKPERIDAVRHLFRGDLFVADIYGAIFGATP